MSAKGPVPISVYPEIREKFRDRIVAVFSKGESQARKRLAKEIEQEFFDAAQAQGLPGQATPYERATADLEASGTVLKAAKSADEVLVARVLANATRRVFNRIDTA